MRTYRKNARDINLYMEFYSLGDISTIINQLKSQNVQIYDIDIERNKSGEALHPSAIFSIRLNEKKIPHTQLLSDLAELDCFLRDRRAVAEWTAMLSVLTACAT